MRFLLKPQARASIVKSQKVLMAKPNPTDSIPKRQNGDVYNHNTNTNNYTNNRSVPPIRQWGQQCSPQCGCTVRFETTVDPMNRHNKILSASYDAKTIITRVSRASNGSAFLEPVMTQGGDCDGKERQNGGRSRPMLKECQCRTLHGLARAVSDALTDFSLTQAQNQMEFAGVRSSPAFRYTVLKNLDLVPTDTHEHDDHESKEFNMDTVTGGHCFDLVEEALTACLKGHIPKPRPTTRDAATAIYPTIGSDHQTCVQRMNTNHNDKNDDQSQNDTLDPLRFVHAAKRRAKNTGMNLLQSIQSSTMTNTPSSSSSSSMPPFHLMGDHDEVTHSAGRSSPCTLTEIQMEREMEKRLTDSRLGGCHGYNELDWVSYVDEMQMQDDVIQHDS